MTSCETADHRRHTRRGIHFHSFKRRITTMSLYYQNMFRSGRGGHVLVSHLPLGSFPSARNKAQIWWVPAMAIHSTLSSSPPTHENKTQKNPQDKYGSRNWCQCSWPSTSQPQYHSTTTVIFVLRCWAMFLRCVWDYSLLKHKDKMCFFQSKSKKQIFFQAAKLFLQTPPLPICWLLSVRTESKYGAVQV